MSPKQDPEFDIYPHLEREIKEATQHLETKPDTLAEAVDEGLARARLEAGDLPEDIDVWVTGELLKAGSKWGDYRPHMPDMPAPFSKITELNPRFNFTITRLHAAKRALSAGNEKNLIGGMPGSSRTAVGETMSLVFIPWQEYRNHLEDENPMTWLGTMRETQAGLDQDMYDAILYGRLFANMPMYRDPRAPSETISPKEYLDIKIAEDGPWGVMLMQTTAQIGAEALEGKSPDEMTEKGWSHADLAGYPIDAMGIFEWWAQTMQEEKTAASFSNPRLLANRAIYDSAGIVEIPEASFYPALHRYEMKLAPAAERDAQVRLAVA